MDSRTSSGAPHAASPARTASRCSSSVTSRCPRAGRRRRPTSSCRSTSRHRRHASARALGQAAHLARRRHDHDWGRKDGFFANEESARVVQRRAQAPARRAEDGLQLPVWFNVGSEAEPQCSRASSTPSRTRWSRSSPREDRGMLFKYGSGTGRPLAHPQLEGAPHGGGRPRPVASCALRRLRGRHQVGADPPRRQEVILT